MAGKVATLYSLDTLPVSSILLNAENDRHGHLAGQPEIFAWLIENHGIKLTNLAADIAEHGINPTERLLVRPANKKNLYTVWEGNRRLASIKLLKNPNLATDKKLRDKIAAISKSARTPVPDFVDCVISNDKPLIDRLILIKHTGENNGIGTVSWGAEENARFLSRQGMPARNFGALQVIEFIKGSQVVDDETLAGVPVTTLQRLLNDPDVRGFIGLIQKEGMLHAEIAPTELLKPLG